MSSNNSLSLMGLHHQELFAHAFPGDGLEAAAILICGRSGQKRLRLTVEKLIPVPLEKCSHRSNSQITWPGKYLDIALDSAESGNSSIILAHSHPGGFPEFSHWDDASDQKTIPSIQHALNHIVPHGSAILLPNGRMKLRIYDEAMQASHVTPFLVGEDIRDLSPHVAWNVLAYSERMREKLSNMTACVIGVSGTGSIVAECLARLGIGRLILIDFDRVEFKNLNRILNSTIEAAVHSYHKTEVLKNAIMKYRDDIVVDSIEAHIDNPKAIAAASDADILFSCVDSMDGRHFADLISQCCLCPLIDVGVTIPTRRSKEGGHAIADVVGRVDYVFPGGPTLFDRGVVTSDGLRSEYLRHANRKDYDAQLAEGYIKGQIEEAPSVISLNMRAASAAIQEWLARLFEIRHEANERFARTLFSLASLEEEFTATTEFLVEGSDLLGRGLKKPLLGMPSLEEDATK